MASDAIILNSTLSTSQAGREKLWLINCVAAVQHTLGFVKRAAKCCSPAGEDCCPPCSSPSEVIPLWTVVICDPSMPLWHNRRMDSHSNGAGIKSGLAFASLLLTCNLSGAARGDWTHFATDNAAFSARLIIERSEIKNLTGSDLDGDYVLVELQIRPLYNYSVVPERDDFVLRSRRNNERSRAMSPHAIAGEPGLVLGSVRGSSAVVKHLPSLLASLVRLELPMKETQSPVHGYLYFQVSAKQRKKNIRLMYDGPAGEFTMRFD